jgi:integrase/recombinase XerD
MTTLTADELRDLLNSWLLRLRALRRSDHTLTSYRVGVQQFLTFCEEQAIPPRLNPDTLAAFVNHLLDTGRKPATAQARQVVIRLFSSWLADEGEIGRDLLANVKLLKLDDPVVPSLTDDQLKALFAACKGKTFVCKRDEAIVRFMAETGCRAGELLNMTVDDIDLQRGSAIIRRGKGGRGRQVPFGPQTAAAIDRYLRMRRRHKLVDAPALWLGASIPTLSYAGLLKALKARARSAGIDHFTPHQLRHTFASRWLRANGSEQGLMTTAGWSRHEMLRRYTADTAADRAHDEARNLHLGDL